MSKAAENGTKIFSEQEWAEIIEGLSLSPRESQIIKCLFADEPDKKIAMDLKIAIPTVRTHMHKEKQAVNYLTACFSYEKGLNILSAAAH